MDKVDSYRRIIQQIVAHHAEYAPSHGQIEAIPICDIPHDNYLLMDVGWDRTGRVHAVVFHLRIREGKIWVEWDGTEPGITQELLEAGVPKEEIVLAFYRPERRTLTEFAIA
ncbi:MAG: XisI protein [Candidatus Tectomicrobia bacterium]|uniref:XisI protein n=1 Tax=Tectimicrobiota bacterium TaxID=2528274 RepID=A0A932CMK7_UNCTE|nr:XisI protein [Candidatus Tectomicrobia bacterium]